MVKMKLKDDEFDTDELDVEYEGPQFERYHGDIPKTGTILTARVTKAWWLMNDNDESQMKLLAIAEGNDGQLKEYNGLPTWETLTWTPKNARRYQPFLLNFGLSVKDIKNKMDVEAEDDNIGTPINSIAGWEPGSDDALCQIVIKRDYWNDEWRSKVDWDGWLEFDPDLYVEPDDEDEEEEPARPTRGRSSSRSAAAKPAASSKRGAATRSRRQTEPEPDDEDEELDEEEYDDDDIEDDDEEEQEAARPARSSRRAAPARPSRPAARKSGTAGRSAKAARPARSTGRSRSRSADEPPF
jgi:hypothetical protein